MKKYKCVRGFTSAPSGKQYFYGQLFTEAEFRDVPLNEQRNFVLNNKDFVEFSTKTLDGQRYQVPDANT